MVIPFFDRSWGYCLHFSFVHCHLLCNCSFRLSEYYLHSNVCQQNNGLIVSNFDFCVNGFLLSLPNELHFASALSGVTPLQSGSFLCVKVNFICNKFVSNDRFLIATEVAFFRLFIQSSLERIITIVGDISFSDNGFLHRSNKLFIYFSFNFGLWTLTIKNTLSARDFWKIGHCCCFLVTQCLCFVPTKFTDFIFLSDLISLPVF